MLPQRKFVRGLDASTPIFNQPQGSIPRGGSLVLTKRGGLRIADGSYPYSLQDGAVQTGVQPIFDIILMQIWGVTPILIAVTYDTVHSQYALIVVPTTSYDPTTNLVSRLPYIAISASPRFLQFNNLIILYGDQLNPPYFWNGAYGSNSTTTWTASHVYTVGTFIFDGTYIQQVVATTGTGHSGSSAPSWGTQIGDLTVDNNVTWINRGYQLPFLVTNQFVIVYPQWVPAQPYTAGTIIQVGFYSGTRCGYWQPNTALGSGAIIIDSNNNVQEITSTSGNGQTGEGSPIWNTTSSGTTTDNNVTWTNKGAATFYNFMAQQDGTSGAGPQPPLFSNTVNSVTSDGGIGWIFKGATAGSAIAPRGAKFAIVYAGSLWVANTSPFTTSDNADGPTCLKMSDLNNPNSWNPVNVAFLGKDDGTEITGMATFTIAETGITPTGSLVVFKTYSTWQVIGVFGSDSFAIDQAQTDMGCIAPDTIQFIPGFGIARLTHNGPAYFDGVRDRLFGEQIRSYLFPDDADIVTPQEHDLPNAWGTQVANPPMYVLGVPMSSGDVNAGGVTRLFCYDLVLKAWGAPIDIPWPISCIRQIRPDQISNNTPVVNLTGGSSDGAIRQMFAGDTAWYSPAPNIASINVVATVRTPEVFGKSVADRISLRGLYVRGLYVNNIVATVTLDTGVVADNVAMSVVQLGSEFEAWLPIFGLGKHVHADITLSTNVGGEVHSFDWDIEPQPAAPSTLI